MIRFLHRSSDLPPCRDNEAAVKRWMAFYQERCGALDVTVSPLAPFSQLLEGVTAGATSVWHLTGAIDSGTRSRAQIACDGDGRFSFALNANAGPLRLARAGREDWIAPGAAALVDRGEPVEIRSGLARSRFFNFAVPRAALLARLPQAEDMIGRPLQAGLPQLAYLAEYGRFLLGAGSAGDALAAHVEATLADLVALALGAAGEGAQASARAALLRRAVMLIETHYFKRDFTVARLARLLGRPLAETAALIEETGTSFERRVLELRLDYARCQIDSARRRAVDIAALARDCGFASRARFESAYALRYGFAPGGAALH